MEPEKTVAENGEEEKNEAETGRRRLGGIRTMPFILGEFLLFVCLFVSNIPKLIGIWK